MKKVFLLITMIFVLATIGHCQDVHNTRPSVTYSAVITRVIDGDTVAFQANWLPAPLKPELSIRIYGVDTPEKGFRAKCDSENQRGEAATNYTKHLIDNGHKFQISIIDWDKYGGRVLGDVIIDGISLRKQLIENNYAREYYGEAKTSWCN